MGVLRLRWTGVVRSELWIEVDEKGIRVNRIEVGLMVSSIGIGIGIEGGVGEFEFNVQGFNSREFEIQLQSQRV